MGDSADGNERLDEEAAAEIRANLGRILSSDIFRAAPQLSAFLTFIVDRTVEGRSAELKGYTIAVEALGRPPEFDPQADPIVRVEAGRLRKALAQYYSSDGRQDALRITVPVGAYVPLFLRSEPDRNHDIDGDEAPVLRRGRDRRWPLAVLAGLAVGLLALAYWYALAGAGDPAQPDQAQLPPDLPTVAIRLPQAQSDPVLADRLARATSVLVDVMARFDDLLVVKAPAAGAALPDGTDYVLEMSLRSTEGTLEAFSRLQVVKDGRIIWASSNARPLDNIISDQALADRMRRIATRLAQPYGVIHADGRQSPASAAGGCIYEAFDYQRFMTREQHEAALQCLERIIARDPSFYPARAHLAALLLLDHASGREVESRRLLDRALSTALAAQRLAPLSARAQQVVMDALFLRGDTADAVSLGREALVRNPYDPFVMADLGAVYVRLDRAGEGLPLLEHAIELSPGRPSWYDFYAYLAAWMSGAEAQARLHFAVLATDGSPLGLLAQALQAGRDGDLPRRQDLLRQLAELAPVFQRNPNLYLARKGFNAAAAERLLAQLGFEPS